jgi:ribosomal protein S18 acetylase RimI-like enzyme
MEILKLDAAGAERLAPFIADFRVTLNSYRGIVSEPDREAGKAEALEYLQRRYPIFVAEDEGETAGYIVCRVEDSLLWVEQLYVRPDRRREGIASLLFDKAEEVARSLGEETVFNYVHPNNKGVIGFLRSKGYTVLNLIEIRKPYQGEKLSTKITVNGHVFDY